MKVILAHDSYTQYGGAERVMSALHELYPQSPVLTLVVDEKMKPYLPGWEIVTSPLQKIYNFYPHFQHLFPLIPIALRFFNWKEPADILLSSSSSFIKALIKPRTAIHINYCHTPTRFLWVDPNHAYKEIPFFLRWLARIYMTWLKGWDLRKAKQVDYFIANSSEVQKRIKKYYGRDSEVITPFIESNFWKPTRSKGDYFLVAGRLQYAKGIEHVIEVCNTLNLPLHIVGTGRYEEHLKSIAKSNVTFLGRVSDEQLRDEFSGARGFVYPQLEDFGIMPLEAAACGTATLGLGQGGSLETIVPGQTGELMNELSTAEIQKFLTSWDETKYSQEQLINHAKSFDKAIFQQKVQDFINKVKL